MAGEDLGISAKEEKEEEALEKTQRTEGYNQVGAAAPYRYLFLLCCTFFLSCFLILLPPLRRCYVGCWYTAASAALVERHAQLAVQGLPLHQLQALWL
jgi:hypothetical protein